MIVVGPAPSSDLIIRLQTTNQDQYYAGSRTLLSPCTSAKEDICLFRYRTLNIQSKFNQKPEAASFGAKTTSLLGNIEDDHLTRLMTHTCQRLPRDNLNAPLF